MLKRVDPMLSLGTIGGGTEAAGDGVIRERSKVMEALTYNLGVIRNLLLAAFTAGDLRRFCQDLPAFCAIVDRFGPGHGFDVEIQFGRYC